jgi:hypothetical protein
MFPKMGTVGGPGGRPFSRLPIRRIFTTMKLIPIIAIAKFATDTGGARAARVSIKLAIMTKVPGQDLGVRKFSK